VRDDIRIGATFPDYDLPDHTDTPRKLPFLQGGDPMVLTLNRSVFCPKDRRQLTGLAAFYPEICVGYARLVTIIAENLVMTNDLRLGVGAFWPFLHDEKRIVPQDLQRLLVLGTAVDQRAACGPARGDTQVPLGFRPGESGGPRRLAARREAPLLPIRQIIQADVRAYGR